MVGEEEVEREAERLRAELREERIRGKRDSETITPGSGDEETSRLNERENGRSRNVRREEDLRDEKEMALHELQKLIQENDRLLREMEQKEREREHERALEKEVEAKLAYKAEAMRKEAMQQRETIECLQKELAELMTSQLKEENQQVHKEHLQSLEEEKAKLAQTLASLRSDLDHTQQKMKDREKEWEETKRQLEEERKTLRREKEERITAMQSLINELKSRGEQHRNAFGEERRANLETRQKMESLRATLESSSKHVEELKKQLARELENTERLQEELSKAELGRDEKANQLSLLELKLQQKKRLKRALREELNEEKKTVVECHEQIALLTRERDVAREARASLESDKKRREDARALVQLDLDQTQKLRAEVEEKLKRSEEERSAGSEALRRAAAQMSELQLQLEHEREERRRLGEMLELERGRVARLEREQFLEPQSQKERAQVGSEQQPSNEEARLQAELDLIRKSRDTILSERERETGELKVLGLSLEKERMEKQEVQADLVKLREILEEERQKRESLASSFDAERRSWSEAKGHKAEAQKTLTGQIETLRSELHRERKAKDDAIESALRQGDVLQKELQARQELITLKKAKSKLLRQKILELMEENQRIKEKARREREEEAKKAREEKERRRQKQCEKERQVKEERLAVRREEGLDNRGRRSEEGMIRKLVFTADPNIFCADDMSRCAADLNSYLTQHGSTPVQRKRLFSEMLSALSNVVQRDTGSIEMQSFWISSAASLSHSIFERSSIPISNKPTNKDPLLELRRRVLACSVKERGIVSRIWIDNEKRNISRDEVEEAFNEAIGKETASGDARVLLELEVLMLRALSNLLSAMMGRLAPTLVPAIIEYRPLLSRRSSMIRREREKEAKRRRPHIPESADRSTATPGDVLQALKSFFQTLQQKRLSPAVVQGIFEDAAHTINAYLFNTLVERGELCTSATGFQTKFGLSPIREWFFAAHFENPSRIRDCLVHIEEAANLLVVDKQLFTNEKDLQDIFHFLNPVQILHLLTAFRNDEGTEEAVPSESLRTVRRMIAQSKQVSLLRLKLDPRANPLPPLS